MRAPTGGGGSRIVVNPAELRRGGKRLRGLGADLKSMRGRVRGAAVPAMPSDLIGAIQSGVEEVASLLEAIPSPLAEAAVELDRRALWAEVADELIAGVPLSGAQLRQFMDGLRDGSLVRYAEPWQAELAGAYVAGMYSENYKEPEKLIELARLLQANGHAGEPSGAFMAGFVERFGTRIVDIPRVIQAMEWTPGMSLGSTDDPFVDFDLGRDLHNEGYQLPVDPVELLGAFSMALALGTASGRVSSSVEHDIAWDDDRWAVAQLLHDGKFGANFLKEAFQSVVVSDIQRDAVRMGPDLTGYMAIGAGDNDGPFISTDERELVMRALLRSPEGAALALSTPLPEDVHIASRWGPVESRDPVAILYAGDWDDDGKLFADVYREATTFAQHEVDAPGTSRQGNEITLQLIERVSNAYRDDLGAVTDALAKDLADHHIRGLIEMGSASGAPYSGDKGIIDLSSGRIVLDAAKLEDLVNALGEREEASKVFVEALGKGEAAFVAEMIVEHPEDAREWGYQVGTINQYVLNAHGVDRELDFGSASDRQKLGMSVFGAGLGALTEGTPYSVLTSPLTAAIDIATSPSHAGMVDNPNFTEKLDSIGAMRAMIATAGYTYGDVPAPTGVPGTVLIDGGRLVDYAGELPDPVRHEFEQWVTEAAADHDVLGQALESAEQGMSEHAR